MSLMQMNNPKTELNKNEFNSGIKLGDQCWFPALTSRVIKYLTYLHILASSLCLTRFTVNMNSKLREKHFVILFFNEMGRWRFSVPWDFRFSHNFSTKINYIQSCYSSSVVNSTIFHLFPANWPEYGIKCSHESVLSPATHTLYEWYPLHLWGTYKIQVHPSSSKCLLFIHSLFKTRQVILCVRQIFILCWLAIRVSPGTYCKLITHLLIQVLWESATSLICISGQNKSDIKLMEAAVVGF